VVSVTKGADVADTQPVAPAPAGSGGGGGASKGLAVTALVMGALGLVAGLAAFMTARRRRTA
jgi:uncharacterized protein HemX